jgi:CheY-like chemotaxis protein
LARLVDDLLDVSRIRRGTIELRKERAEVAAIVEQALETSRPLLDAASHQLSVTVPAATSTSHPATRGVLLLAMTGWGQDEDRRRSREAGFDDHLVKPLDPQLLKDLLARHGGRRQP